MGFNQSKDQVAQVEEIMKTWKKYCVYVVNQDYDLITVDITTREMIKTNCTIKGLTAIAICGTKLCAASLAQNLVFFINAATYEVITTIPVEKPSAVAISQDETKLYVTSFNTNTTLVIDTITYKTIKTIPVKKEPSAIAISSDGKLYIASCRNGTISIFNAFTYQEIITIPFQLPYGLAVSLDGKCLYVTRNYGEISFIETITYQCVRYTSLGCPHGIAISPDGAQLYVMQYNKFGLGANPYENQISVIELFTDPIRRVHGIIHSPVNCPWVPCAIAVSLKEKSD
jgi:YVTN family beta-propeller protein